MDLQLAGKRALVTGASQGIGAAIAATLAQRDWRVVVTDLDLEAARRVAAGLPNTAARHEAAALDVTSAEAAAEEEEAAAEAAAEELETAGVPGVIVCHKVHS